MSITRSQGSEWTYAGIRGRDCFPCAYTRIIFCKRSNVLDVFGSWQAVSILVGCILAETQYPLW